MCVFSLGLDKEGIQQCRLRTKSPLFRTAATCIDQNWHKHCQSVQSTVSPSLPPTTGGNLTSIQPLVWPFRVSNWTAVRKQCQDCYPEHFGINGENLAFILPQVSHWKLSLQHGAQSVLCVFGVGLKAIHVKSSLSVTALGLITTLFSQLCTLLLSILVHDMIDCSWRNGSSLTISLSIFFTDVKVDKTSHCLTVFILMFDLKLGLALGKKVSLFT